jgi:ABC-type nitrate/sulfonate/bicarbonate transport system substrate-binding protein
VGEDAGLNNLGAANDYVGEWQFTTYNVNGDWAKANPAKAEGFLRALLRATDWIYRNRAMSAEIAAREMNIKIAYAERAWDYYTSTGTLTRDLAFSPVGLRKVFDTQIKAGLLPASRTFDMSNYVVSDYLERARATVAKD